MELLFLVHLAATLFMVGVIWFVQVVHYPLFGRVGAAGFVAYAEAHSRLTGYVVAPPMLAELATGVALLFRRPEGVPAALPWAGFALLAAAWASTALLQVPKHRALGAGFDRAAHRFLVTSNWLRTAAWSGRGLVVIWMAALALG